MELFQINYSHILLYYRIMFVFFFFWYVGQDLSPSVSFSPCKPPLPHEGPFLPTLISVRAIWRASVGSQLGYSPLKCHALAGAAYHHQLRHIASSCLREMEPCPSFQEEAGRVDEVMNNDYLVISSSAITHTKYSFWGGYMAASWEPLCPISPPYVPSSNALCLLIF